MNINPDSVVYVDNSSYERKEVEDNLKEVRVLDIGDNVFDYSEKLKLFGFKLHKFKQGRFKRAEKL